MDIPLADMDDFHLHLRPIPRRYPSCIPLSSIGYLPRKRHRISEAFGTFNFSLIFAGTGTYHDATGKLREVAPPCVLTQTLDVHAEYGPGPGEHWTELFLIYAPETLPMLRQCGLASEARSAWPMASPEMALKLASELIELASGSPLEDHVDRMDRIAERLVLETLLPTEAVRFEDPEARAVESIRASMRLHLDRPFDLQATAHKHGFSPSALRRAWMRHVKIPPVQYFSELRMQQACRLLAETNLRVSEIARKLGYEDPLYFSRQFRRMIGTPASDYRKMHNTWRNQPAGSGINA